MLMGPSYLEIQVKDPVKKYRFDQLQLLKDVIMIMSNMSSIASFVNFVVNDGRFDIENFKKAQMMLSKHREYEHIQKCKTLLSKIKEAQAS